MNEKKGKVIALHLTKGGVGKTTTLINLGFSLRDLGFNILFVDADPQHSLTEFFPINNNKENLLDLLSGKVKTIFPTPISQGVSIIEGSGELHSTNLEHTRLKEVLEQYKLNYDYILIDTSPAISNITLNAMNACDKIFLPVEATLMGLQAINKTFLALNTDLTAKLGGIFITRYKKNRVASETVEEILHKNEVTRVLKTYIREASLADNAHLDGKAVVELYPNSALALDYRNLTSEILEKLNN